jgi:flavin-binding protein dodecin
LSIPKARTTLSNLSAPAPKVGKIAARNVVEEAAKHLRELRVAEVMKKDLVIRNGKVDAYRTKVKLSFKYEPHR